MYFCKEVLYRKPNNLLTQKKFDSKTYREINFVYTSQLHYKSVLATDQKYLKKTACLNRVVVQHILRKKLQF